MYSTGRKMGWDGDHESPGSKVLPCLGHAECGCLWLEPKETESGCRLCNVCRRF